ncbi:hypothetical protein LCGC14_1423230 [marine sediment metagenome]|uniref:Uncharacterized protein n=1 Tax=marine sediment metagenome TaxID=412755 RepID=A0A0F9MSG2_9ZZZZ
MPLAVYDIKELGLNKGFRCIWCLVISTATINRATLSESRAESLHVYETENQRDNALKYWQREYKLNETVFFVFEIPIEFYLENALKLI